MDREDCWDKKRESIRRYDRTAKGYDLLYREEQRRKYEAASETLNPLKDQCVLDLGSGTGLFMEFAGSGGLIIGVDCSKNMLKRAKRRCGNHALVCADADHLPFVGQIFDRVFSFTLLQNMPDPERTMVEMRRVAKAGSEIVISVARVAFTEESFLRLLHGLGLAVTKFIDDEDLKDYLLICRGGGG